MAAALSESPQVQHSHPVRIATLDGLRALALLSVLIHHYTPVLVPQHRFWSGAVLRALDLGGLGVDLFFALSGFLITGILYDSKGAPDFFRRFYWRRSLRIFPAYYLYLTPFLLYPIVFQQTSFLWFAAYLRNWRGLDLYSDRFLGHLWSLAVEEQFYIFWAVAVYLVARRRLPWLILALCALAPACRAWMYSAGLTHYELVRWTPSRMDGLLLGGMVAIAVRVWDMRMIRTVAAWAAGFSLAAFTAVNIWPGPGESVVSITGSSWCAIFFASVVALSLDLKPASLVHRALTNGFLERIARYSYAMYLIHLFPHVAALSLRHRILARFPALDLPIRIIYVPLLCALVYFVARLSWKYIEEPCLRLKDRMPFGPSLSPNSPKVFQTASR